MSTGFLGKWTPRDTALQLQRLARYTFFVGISKYTLVGLAILLVSLVFIVPAFHDETGGARIVFTNIQSGEAGKPVMSKPNFQGMDAKNQPYSVTADVAEQQDDGTVLLKQMQADISLSNGTWLAFMADIGVFNPDKNTLLLPEKVNVFYDAGYEMRASEVFIDLKKATATSTKPVEGQGMLGTLNADGFSVDNERQYIIFQPKARVKLYTKGKK